MKRLAIVVLALLSLGPASAADLLAVYQRALQHDPQLREAENTRLAALEAKPQALSALLPQLSGTGLISRERDSGTQNQTQALSLPPCAATVLPTDLTPCAPAGTPTTIFESFGFTGRTNTTTH